MATILESDKVERLAIKVEEAARSTKEGIKNFIEPARGTLRRAMSKRHHFIFGRRGSGKSSLLIKAASDLSLDRRPIAKVDLEVFKGHSYPDVLLSVLIKTLEEFKTWLGTVGVNPTSKVTWWKSFFGKVPQKSALNRKAVAGLSEEIGKKIVELNEFLHSAENANVEVLQEDEAVKESQGSLGGGIKSPVASLESKLAASKKESTRKQVETQFAARKVDFLHRNILEYQKIFERMGQLSGGGLLPIPG